MGFLVLLNIDMFCAFASEVRAGGHAGMSCAASVPACAVCCVAA
jgi:hypothetical protein